MPDALVLQHIAAEQPYTIRAALEAAGVTVHTWLAGAGEALPDIAGFDGLVVMGGPQSAYSDDEFPTRLAEVALIRTAHAQDIPILGVCLGAQLIAVALGGTGHRGQSGFECGWATVTRTEVGDRLFDGIGVDAFPALHWHGDSFTLPPDAVLLASSERYEHQAFRAGATTWGVQFHIEVDEGAVDCFLRAFTPEAETHAAGGVAGIRAATPAALAAVNPVRDQVFGRFAALVAG